MTTTPATRSELLALRQRVTFAAQGRDLLKDKRTALIREFRAITADLLTRYDALTRHSARSRLSLARANAVAGNEAVSSASLNADEGVPVTLRTRAVAGVTVVDLEHTFVGRPTADRGYALALTPPHVDGVAEAYEREVEQLLEVSAVELTARRLSAEIARTTRQVNALDNIVVPRLQAEARRVVLVLDEREREERARLRRARARRA